MSADGRIQIHYSAWRGRERNEVAALPGGRVVEGADVSPGTTPGTGSETVAVNVTVCPADALGLSADNMTIVLDCCTVSVSGKELEPVKVASPL